MIYTPNCEIKPGMSLPNGVQRYALVVEYNGAGYQGFQKQGATANTVQAKLETALSSVAAQPVTVVCAGRTDAGVHATRQVVHFDTAAQRPLRAWREGVNTRLPDSIRVHQCWEVGAEFHARFSALGRIYRYITLCNPVRSALLANLVTCYRQPLDPVLMQQGADCLLGEHDFSSFRASQCQAHSPVRRIEYVQISRQGPLLITEIKANAFLHHMVRNIMGALFEVGRDARPPGWISELRQLRDRTRSAPTAPPYGLYFVGVEYPDAFAFPSMPYGPCFIEQCDSVPFEL